MNHAKTGRTTRMLEEAKRLALEGKTVHVVFDTAYECLNAKAQYEFGSSIRFVTPSGFDFDWERLEFIGIEGIVLVDHHVIEDRFAPLLEMLHRFDLEPPSMKPEKTTQSQQAGRQSGLSGIAGSDSFDPIQLIRAQEYMLRRQQELLDAAIKRNNAAVAALCAAEVENAKLRKELDGYRNGKLWTMIVSMLPTREMFRR